MQDVDITDGNAFRHEV
jgi:hypothetical protein